MNRDHKKYIQTAIQQMKRCSTSLIKETQSKGKQRSHVSPVNLKNLQDAATMALYTIFEKKETESHDLSIHFKKLFKKQQLKSKESGRKEIRGPKY